MKAPKDSLLLIDGHALLYRSFHGMPPLQTKDGTPTHAIFGFINTIFKAIEELQPKYIAVSFDLSGPTFRHKSFEGYKAHRAPMPDGLSTQIPLAQELVASLNIPIFTKEGFEADDVIGTLAAQAKPSNVPVVIATGDKDSFQLVDDSTFVYSMRRSMTDTALYDREAVIERMGVTPEQIPHYKALAGDASDAIPGIAGIGEKTAITILKECKTIDTLYDTIHAGKEIPGISQRIYDKIKEGEAIARQSLELATIDRDVPITLKLEDCVVHEYDDEAANQVFQKLEFFSLFKRLPTIMPHKETPQTKADTPHDWDFTLVTTKAELEAMILTLTGSDWLAVDTETDGLSGPIIGISLANSGTYGYYIPTVAAHGAELTKEEIATLLKPFLEDPRIKKIGHNIKYDMCSLDQLGITLAPISFDTMIAAYLLHSHIRSFDFDSTAQRELGYTPISFSDTAGSKKKEATLLDADAEKVAEYAAEDAVITYRLFEHFSKLFKDNPDLQKIATTLEFPLIPVLKAMEQHGVCIDKHALNTLEKKLATEIERVQKEIESCAKEPININSPAQLQKLLFEELQLSSAGLSKTQNGISTAAQELEKLQGQHPIIDAIMKYRELTKLQNTYVKTLPELIDEAGRIHTEFSQTTAATGRLSSVNPNLQNIPIRSELGNEIRKAFTAPRGYTLVSLDYSQFELRIIAHLSGDKKLQQVFLDNRDIHAEVAKQLGIDRRGAKAINFGIVYGLSAFGLAQALKIDPKTARQYIDAYFATYPELHAYLEKTKQQIREQGYVETLFGRRREIPEIHAANAIVRAQAERMAINAPAQGTEADLMKLAMIRTHDWIEQEYTGQKERPYLLLQIHDSFLFEVPEGEVKKVSAKAKEIMEGVTTLDVPLIVDCSTGANWGELVKDELAV